MSQTSGPVWEARGSEKRIAVQRMFAEIAPCYDRLNAWISLRLHRSWRRTAVQMLNLAPGERALDVCTGTGDFLPILRQAVSDKGVVGGLDFCRPMIDRARAKSDIPLMLGDACALPVQSETFDAVTVGWGIRNVPDIDLAHREIARVLRPGGRFVSLDMARPRNPLIRTISELLFRSLVPFLGRSFGNANAYTYLPKSTERFWSREELSSSMQRAGFNDVRTKDIFCGNLCIHYGRKPLPKP